jgi:hypothetical protein
MNTQTLELSEVSPDFQVKIRASFGDLLTQTQSLAEKAQEIVAMPESAMQEKQARECRLSLVKIRTGADKIHKEMKQDILVQGRAIDGAKNIVIAATTPIEKELKAIEDRAEIRAEEARQKLHAERIGEIAKYSDAYASFDFGRMSNDEFAGLLENAKLAHEAMIARQKAEEEARIAAEKAEREERERLAKEHAEMQIKLAAERAEREKAEAEQKRIADEAEKALAEERAKAEQERAKLEAEMKAQREKSEAAERAAKAEADRLAKIEADRIAAEKTAKEAAEAEAKKAALAPDKEKIAAYAKAIKAIDMPIGTTTDGKAACLAAATAIDKALAEIRAIYTSLK